MKNKKKDLPFNFIATYDGTTGKDNIEIHMIEEIDGEIFQTVRLNGKIIRKTNIKNIKFSES